MDLDWMIILPSAEIKKAQYFGLVLDSFFTLEIQIDEKKRPLEVDIKRYLFWKQKYNLMSQYCMA